MSNFVGFDFGANRQELGLTGREFQAAKRAAFAAMGKEWHAKYRNLHFTPSASARYGYAKRKGEGLSGKARARSYHGRKERMADKMSGTSVRGGSRAAPLVYSGEGWRLAQLLDLRVTSKQARVVLPRKFNFKNPKSRIDMRAELTKVLQPEADEITQVGATAFGRSLDDIYRSKQ